MGVAVMADGPGPQLFWRVLDALDFWLTQARLWVADAVAAPIRIRRPIELESIRAMTWSALTACPLRDSRSKMPRSAFAASPAE